MPLPMTDQQLTMTIRRVELYTDYGDTAPDPADVRALLTELRRLRADYTRLQAAYRQAVDEQTGQRRPVF